MNKDTIVSLVLHLALFIIIGLSNLFFYQTIVINQINVSLVSSSALENTSNYKPLNIDSKDIVKIDDNNQEAVSKKTQSNNDKGSDNDTKQSLKATAEDSNNKSEIQQQSTIASSSVKDNVANEVDKSNSKANDTAAVKTQAIDPNKEKFLKNILNGLDKGELSNAELAALNTQLKGCWYGQGGHSADEDVRVKLTLTMNEDATIENIKVENEDSYDTPLRKAILMQVLRALKDPKCKQLRLPINGYANWRVIHMVFDPEE
ncbi:hypothetical protein ACFX5K_05360 [Rickettsiales bacterium LUAb2]